METMSIAAPLVATLGLMLLLCPDYLLMLGVKLWRGTTGRAPSRDDDAPTPPTLVVVPSLLRERGELTSMLATITSIVQNGYPGDLTLVVSIDGTSDAPLLYAELRRWAARQVLPPTLRLWITGTPERRSKPMAIDHAVELVKARVAAGALPAFPQVYISTDADADLGPRAIERLVKRLQRTNPITGWPARAVAGALHVRGNDFWKGWRHFFTVGGQLNLQVAREYFVGNMWRFNVRWLPITGVPGALYCTWSEIFVAIPKFMGYMRTLRTRDWLAWWVGVQPPKFSESDAEPIPALMAGDTDDTVTAYAAVIARWENGHFTFDPPRTPLHALYYLLRSYFIDRALHFAPEAKIYTSSPTTVRALFKQRKRWNSSRVELTGRFWRALGYHWTLGVPAMTVKVLIANTILAGLWTYARLPAITWSGATAFAFSFGYLAMLLNGATATIFALAVNDFRHWRLLFAMPLAPLYQLVFNWLPGTVGVLSDLLLFGNRTGFAPEKTLIQGGSVRLALAYRVKRAFLLTLRAALFGDVPFGAFWFGWRETRWTPSGFEGFTSTHARRSILWPEGPRPSATDAAPPTVVRAPALTVRRTEEHDRAA
ncbi:MAG: hypothetical protein JST00_26120 [Deltaproteobacteria bacterium]|nr:hypothetical protein [Deltaproteobacteria bacterium]